MLQSCSKNMHSAPSRKLFTTEGKFDSLQQCAPTTEGSARQYPTARSAKLENPISPGACAKHHEIWNNCHSTGQARAKVLHTLKVQKPI